MAFASVLPAAMLVLTPLLLGVPHVASDARYLVLRPRVPRGWAWCVAGASVSLVGLRILEGWSAIDAPFGWVVVAAVDGARRARAWGRLAVALPVTLAIGAVAIRAPDLARVVFANLHNVVRVVIWVLLFRRSRVVAVPALMTLVAAVLLALTGIPRRSRSSWGPTRR
jgi:hypothetical protein